MRLRDISRTWRMLEGGVWWGFAWLPLCGLAAGIVAHDVVLGVATTLALSLPIVVATLVRSRRRRREGTTLHRG